MSSTRAVSIHAMPRQSFWRTFFIALRRQCTIDLFKTAKPETEAERRLRFARAAAELAEHILEFQPTERARLIARALELADVDPANVPKTDVFRT